MSSYLLDTTLADQSGSVQAYQAEADKAKHRRDQAREERYNQEFKSEAVLLRNEILARLPTLPPGGIWGPGAEYRIDLSAYGFLLYIVQLEGIANSLESLAKLLPQESSSSKLQIRSVIPASIAGVTRIVRWIRQKL